MTRLDLPAGVGSHSLEVNGCTMHYLEAGTAEAGRPSLLFIHGNTGSCRWWDLVLPFPGYQAIAPDLPNFGQSGAIDGCDIDLYADYLRGFAAKLGLKQLILVGHSLGGAVAMSLASRFPSEYAGLVLVDSSSPDGLVTPEAHYPVIELFKTNRELLANALGAVMPGLTDPVRKEALVDLATRMHPPAFAGNARALARFSARAGLADCTAPVLVVWGSRDAIITEAMVEATLSAFKPGQARLARLDTGHSPMVEAPGLFRDCLSDFLDKGH